MKTYILSLLVALCLISAPVFTNAVEEPSKEQGSTSQSAIKDSPQEGTKQDSKKEVKSRAILSMRDKTLAQLFETNPEAKAEVEKSVGYAVFDATGINVVLVCWR